MTNYSRGRIIEWRARDELQRRGYTVIRSAGSKSPIDLVAIGPHDVILVQCKRAKCGGRIRRGVVQGLEKMTVPGNVSLQVWLWRDRKGFDIHELPRAADYLRENEPSIYAEMKQVG